MVARITITMTMTSTASLLNLMAWLSPVFPTGGFAYSSALEQAVVEHWVTDKDSLNDWVEIQLTHGSLWNDLVFAGTAHDYAMRGDAFDALVDLSNAIIIGKQRLEETLNQGKSFLKVVSHWVDTSALAGLSTPLPIAVGCAAGLNKIDKEQALSAYIHAYVSNQFQCAIRLSIIGQNGAAELLAKAEPAIAKAAQKAANSCLDDIGSSTIMVDIASMRHETLEPRLFRS